MESMDDDYIARVQSAIRRDVARWMPFLIVREAKVVIDDDRNRTYVEVEYSLNTSPSVTDSVVLEF